jgi:hypothetical protein
MGDRPLKDFLAIARPLCRSKGYDLLAVVAMASLESDRTFEEGGPASDPGKIGDHYGRAFSTRKPKKPVDYYLATWGAAPGLPDDTVIAVKGETKFEAHPHLDILGEGKIRVRALRILIEGRMLEIGRLPKQQTGLSLFDVLSSLGLFILQKRLGVF